MPANGTAARGASWLLALAPAVMLAVLLSRPVWDVDVFWQLKLGELILANGGPLAGEPFASGYLGQAMPAFAWLGQAAMAGVRLFGGWSGLRIFDALCWLGGMLAVAAACRRRNASAVGVLLALAMAFIAALPVASVRPQSFAALGFGLLVALLRLKLKPWRTTILAVPLLLLWQNLHPSVSVAAVVLGVHAASGWAHWMRGRASGPVEPTVLALLAAGAMLATPDGWTILSWSAANAAASAAMGVSEWLPLWQPINRVEAVAVLAVAAVVAWLLRRNPRRIDAAELAVVIVLFAMTLLAYRFVLFWAIAVIPLVSRAVPSSAVDRRAPRWVAPLAFGLVVVATPILSPTHFAPAIPLGAIDALRATSVKGTVFAHFPWGGPVIDAGYPDWRVAYDGRYYRYSHEEWDRYRRTARGPVDLAEIERIYHPEAFLLSPEWNAALIAALRADPGRWQMLSADRTAVAFVARAPGTP